MNKKPSVMTKAERKKIADELLARLDKCSGILKMWAGQTEREADADEDKAVMIFEYLLNLTISSLLSEIDALEIIKNPP